MASKPPGVLGAENLAGHLGVSPAAAPGQKFVFWYTRAAPLSGVALARIGLRPASNFCRGARVPLSLRGVRAQEAGAGGIVVWSGSPQRC